MTHFRTPSMFHFDLVVSFFPHSLLNPPFSSSQTKIKSGSRTVCISRIYYTALFPLAPVSHTPSVLSLKVPNFPCLGKVFWRESPVGHMESPQDPLLFFFVPAFSRYLLGPVHRPFDLFLLKITLSLTRNHTPPPFFDSLLHFPLFDSN